MTGADADWVEDVRRWYFNGGRQAPSVAAAETRRRVESRSAALDIGYEAALPAVHSPNWTSIGATAVDS